jgi:hypothetical protein
MNKLWTKEEREFIAANAGIMTDRVLAIKLSQITGRLVTLQSVRKQRQKMGITKKRGRGICKVVEKPQEEDNGSQDNNG